MCCVCWYIQALGHVDLKVGAWQTALGFSLIWSGPLSLVILLLWKMETVLSIALLHLLHTPTLPFRIYVCILLPKVPQSAQLWGLDLTEALREWKAGIHWPGLPDGEATAPLKLAYLCLLYTVEQGGGVYSWLKGEGFMIYSCLEEARLAQLGRSSPYSGEVFRL